MGTCHHISWQNIQWISGEGRGRLGKIWCPAETTGVLRRTAPVMPCARRGIRGLDSTHMALPIV